MSDRQARDPKFVQITTPVLAATSCDALDEAARCGALTTTASMGDRQPRDRRVASMSAAARVDGSPGFGPAAPTGFLETPRVVSTPQPTRGSPRRPGQMAPLRSEVGYAMIDHARAYACTKGGTVAGAHLLDVGRSAAPTQSRAARATRPPGAPATAPCRPLGSRGRSISRLAAADRAARASARPHRTTPKSWTPRIPPRAVLDTLRADGAGLGSREAVTQGERCPPAPMGPGEKGLEVDYPL